MDYLFVPYDIALKMKALGFDEPCFFLLNSSDDDPKPFLASPPEPMDWNTLYTAKTNIHLLSAPTFSQAFKFIREKYMMAHEITCPFVSFQGKGAFLCNDGKYELSLTDEESLSLTDEDIYHTSYESAELKALTKLIEIIELHQKSE